MAVSPSPSRVRHSTLTYSLVVSRGYVRLVRRGERLSRRVARRSFVRRGAEWVESGPGVTDVDEPTADQEAHRRADADDRDAWWVDDPEPADPYVEAALDEAMHPRRGDGGQTARSRMNMRRLFVSLPWELVGPRPALISLTYPGVWQPWVPDGRVWEAHRRAFERRWVRRWGESLVGVWVKEFQTSGRPHLHLYVGLPSTMEDDDFAGLRERTLLRHRLERQHGRYDGRKRTPPIGLGSLYGGEFGQWLRTAWSEVVGTSPGTAINPMAPDGDPHHQVRGVDVAVMFWSDKAEAGTDRTVVAQYLARETGKWRQKQPPAGFVKVGRFYGVWGKSVGFEPEATAMPLEPLVAAEVEARLARWVNWKLHTLRRGTPAATALALRHRGDGITAFGLGPDQAARIVRWSEEAAGRKQTKIAKRGAGGAASGDLVELLRSLDLLTGEIVSPEEADGVVEHG